MKFLKQTTYILVLILSLSWLDAVAQTRQTREEYIDKYKHIAIEHMERYGIPASITLAQGILESDSGNSNLARRSNNHFGIKCKSNWKGERVYHTDDAPDECFRKYDSVEESYEDHAEFLDQSPRYDSLFAYSSSDYRSWARGLKAAGYATAPDYAQRLTRIIEENLLFLFDEHRGKPVQRLGGVGDAGGIVRRVDEHGVNVFGQHLFECLEVNLKTGEVTTIEIKGRHDPCIVHRAVPCVEAAAAVAITDLIL